MAIVSEEKSVLEWVVFGLSSVLILLLLTFLVHDALSDDGDPPDLRIELGTPEKSAHGFMVPVSVTNKGDRIAQAVEIEVFTKKDPQEAAHLTYDFISSGEVRKGWLGFSGELTEELGSRVKGYRTR